MYKLENVDRLEFKPPVSLGLLLTYKCNISCRYCIYNCSPKWKSDWLGIENADMIFKRLDYIFKEIYINRPDGISFGHGLHFTGGEPFLNFELLLKLSSLANKYEIPYPFVETNCFWAIDDSITLEKLDLLKKAGLKGIMISVNPFNIEKIPFERIERTAELGHEVFGKNTFVYQRFFLELFKRLKIKGTMKFEDLIKRVSLESLIDYIELLPMGRTPYKLGKHFEKKPAEYYFGQNCVSEFTRNWHTHIDNYLNYIPGFCAGISLGKADELLLSDHIDLAGLPIIRYLSEDIKRLFDFSRDYGFKENKNGYISKCHLCYEIRKHLLKNGSFKELVPVEYYERT